MSEGVCRASVLFSSSLLYFFTHNVEAMLSEATNLLVLARRA
jgi:hypothetical protein